jgi:hypothetical protein
LIDERQSVTRHEALGFFSYSLSFKNISSQQQYVYGGHRVDNFGFDGIFSWARIFRKHKQQSSLCKKCLNATLILWAESERADNPFDDREDTHKTVMMMGRAEDLLLYQKSFFVRWRTTVAAVVTFQRARTLRRTLRFSD